MGQKQGFSPDAWSLHGTLKGLALERRNKK
jgi:hypothetical protein